MDTEGRYRRAGGVRCWSLWCLHRCLRLNQSSPPRLRSQRCNTALGKAVDWARMPQLADQLDAMEEGSLPSRRIDPFCGEAVCERQCAEIKNYAQHEGLYISTRAQPAAWNTILAGVWDNSPRYAGATWGCVCIGKP